jgi:hypothetical protein
MVQQRKNSNLHLKHIQIPLDDLLVQQITAVVDRARFVYLKQERPRQKSLDDIAYSARVIVEGLYQAYIGRNKKCKLSIPTSKSGYGKKPYQISTHSHIAVQRVLESLKYLDWIERFKGFKNKDGDNIPTAIKAKGELLDAFMQLNYVWREMGPVNQDVIVLKGYDPKTRLKQVISFDDDPITNRWRKNLKKYNKFLTQHAICLAIENGRLNKLVEQMANAKYQLDWSFGDNKKKPRTFNYLHVQLRRIFARASFAMGGRFYGGWWQFIPSEFRPYITIDGLPTAELDYSEIHPRLMYLEFKQELPEGDLYDLGVTFRGSEYDKNKESYQSKRKVVKTYINALINDDRGRYRLTAEQVKIINMDPKEFEQLVFERHPILREIKGKGRGLAFQFLDSQIAEYVMMDLLAKKIVCLPVHDSFICQEHHKVVLENTMNEAYKKVFKSSPRLKHSEEFLTDFEPAFYPSGQLDLTYMKNMYKDSIHNIFLSSYLQYQQRNT